MLAQSIKKGIIKQIKSNNVILIKRCNNLGRLNCLTILSLLYFLLGHVKTNYKKKLTGLPNKVYYLNLIAHLLRRAGIKLIVILMSI